MFLCNRRSQVPQFKLMNSSAYGYNVSSGPRNRESSSTAVAKNVIVVALGLIINYINGSLIHTFRKHQVRMLYYCFCYDCHNNYFSYY